MSAAEIAEFNLLLKKINRKHNFIIRAKNYPNFLRVLKLRIRTANAG